MARPKSLALPSDPMLLQAMLDGLDLQKQKLEAKISEVQAALGKGRKTAKAAPAPAAAEGAAPARPKRTLSAQARARIAAAQKKRWASFRKADAKKAE